MRTVTLILLAAACLPGEHKAVFPPGVKPIGPYSPGVDTGDLFYVSGQGAADAQGTIPKDPEGQVRQCLNNVKSVLEAGGLTMSHVVYAQVYLADIKHYDVMNKVWATYFEKDRPARATIGVVRMPGNTPVEISAVAVRDLKSRKAIASGRVIQVPVSPAVQVGDRVFLTGTVGRDPKTGTVPKDPRQTMKNMLNDSNPVLKAAGLEWRHLVYANVYVAPSMPLKLLAELLTEWLPSEAGETVIQVASLPFAAQLEVSGVASKSIKRMGNCTSIEKTFYCVGRSGTTKQALEEIKQDLVANKLSMNDVVSTNVYLEDINEFAAMNKVYATYFPGVKPTRTTVQPYKKVAELALAPTTGAEAKPDDSPRAQISVVAVRQ